MLMGHFPPVGALTCLHVAFPSPWFCGLQGPAADQRGLGWALGAAQPGRNEWRVGGLCFFPGATGLHCMAVTTPVMDP